jgi:exodeoxyribonuclease V alpha subunit
MRALAEAVAPDARLVILGDRDQLTSVEAGAVLAEICGPTAVIAGAPGRPPVRPRRAASRSFYSFRFTAGAASATAVAVRRRRDRALTILRDPVAPAALAASRRPGSRPLEAALNNGCWKATASA